MSLSPICRQNLLISFSIGFIITLDLFNLGMAKHENKKFPYKPAKLVDGVKKYVEFWVWSNETKKLIRKRLYKNASLELVEIINKDLEKENIYAPSKIEVAIAEKEEKKQSETAINAFQYALNSAYPRLRKKTKERYKSQINNFCDFLTENYKGLTIRALQQSHVIEYLNLVQETRKISNRTRNAYGSTIRIMLSDLKELDYVDTNVMSGFKNLKEGSSTAHKFYTNEQRQKLKEVISIENPNLWLMCQFMFYTFARPNEIRLLKIGYIETDTNKLYIPAEIAKNKKSERIDIPVQLMQILYKTGFLSYHSDSYLFGKNGTPSNIPTQREHYTKEYSKIRNRLKIPKEYTLYSWKHTGVIEAYKNGLDMIEISQQCRHADLDETRNYMRGLGAYSSEKIKNKFPTL
ncbi:tyrosine-type recombinase/integrase [Bernardetia sp. OM2101]|uniref:tyrosine-type recombinase/integrase n=1 Tax=Bernardetia sp. OM2101 TaxID=3344876 RepID=UPI0035CF2958